MNTIALRQMDETDIDWVHTIEKQNYFNPWTRDGFQRALHEGINYIAESAERQPLGYLCMLTVVDELHLLNISVAPDYQGQGIATQMLETLLQRFEQTEYAVILLEVRRSNKIARRLYQKLGFEQDGIRKNYYPTPTGKEDAVLMSKRLR
jgi:ribosomal-protein-alanine N-acetyltransferase